MTPRPSGFCRLAIIALCLLGACASPSQKMYDSKPPGDNSPSAASQQQGIFNLTKQTVASGVTGMTFALLMAFLGWRMTGLMMKQLEVIDKALERVNEEPSQTVTNAG